MNTPIPKIIHCCWFGGKPLPDALSQYVNGWKTLCPDWEIIIWNEQNFRIDDHPFTKTAYAHRKFAFVSDYVRAWALDRMGGIYLDTDVELKLPLDSFLTHQAFSGFECVGYPFTAVWGAMAGHPLTQKVLAYYEGREYSPEREQPNTAFISQMIVDDYQIDRFRDEHQTGQKDGFSLDIYPSTHFCLDLPLNYASHHFHGSWMPVQYKKISTKDIINSDYYRRLFFSYPHITSSSIKAASQHLTWRHILTIIRYKIKFMFKKPPQVR